MMSHGYRSFLAACWVATLYWVAGGMSQTMADEILRIGLIGLDTSHAEQFALRLNDPANPNYVAGGRIVRAFPAGSPDLPESTSRIEGYTNTLRDRYGVKIVGSAAEACTDVDAVMLLGVDGRPHLEYAKVVMTSGKPFFLDKPAAATLKDVVQIYQLAETAKIPLFSASALRWYPGVVELAAAEGGKPPRSVFSYGPAPLLPHHPDLFFYGIHATEALFTVMGPGCLSVSRTSAADLSVVTGFWAGGRVGILEALHYLPIDSPNYKVIRFGEGQVMEQKTTQGDYTPLLREIIRFFQTKQPPVSAKQTLEIYAFMEAAEESKRRNGAPIKLRDVLVKAGTPEAWLPEPEAPATPPKSGVKGN